MAKEYINPAPIQDSSIELDGRILQPWSEWFRNIERILGRKNNEIVSFTPTFSGLTTTGTTTLNGSYYRFNCMVFFEITIATTGTTSSTSGTTYISNLPFIAEKNGSLLVNNTVTFIATGTGFVQENASSTTNGIVKGYTPSWTSNADTFHISGNYRIKI